MAPEMAPDGKGEAGYSRYEGLRPPVKTLVKTELQVAEGIRRDSTERITKPLLYR